MAVSPSWKQVIAAAEAADVVPKSRDNVTDMVGAFDQ
jgi:hypothetical protein